VLDVWFNRSFALAEFVIHRPMVVLGVLVLLPLASKMIGSGRAKVVPFLASSTFFVFAAHWFYIQPMCQQAVHSVFSLSNPYTEIMAFLLTPVLTVCVCLFICYVLKRYFTKAYNMFTGNR